MRRLHSLRTLTLLGAALLGLAAAAAQGQDDPVGWGYDLPHELMSPFCPGRTLAQCTSPQAEELRQWILLQEAAGSTREQVEATLIERYGDDIRSAPKAEGWGLSAYVLPVLFFVVGGAIIALLLRRLVTQPQGQEPARTAPVPAPTSARRPPLSDEELERLVDEELDLVRG